MFTFLFYKTSLRISSLLFISLLMTTSVVAQPYSVGHTSTTFIDASRNNREIPVEIYYPANENGDDVPVASSCFPVISFGHGFVMMSGAYQNIWEVIVPEGYVMAFVDSETGFNVSHGDYGLDLAFVLEELVGLNTTSGVLFEDKICGKHAVVGHSMGGGASVLAAENSNNINGYIGLAPAETSPSAIGAASSVAIPSLIFSGTADGVTPPADHHVPIHIGLGSDCKTIVNITGGAHCYYANEDLLCDIGEGAASMGISISRAEQQAIMNDYLIPWLAYLNDAEDFNVIQSQLSTDERITFESNCFVTNIFEASEIKCSIFPNPTTDILTIDGVSDKLIGGNYHVFDMLGKEVLRGRIEGNIFSINLQALNKGLYHLVLNGERRTVVKM